MDSIRYKIETGELPTLLAVVHEFCQMKLKSSPEYAEHFEDGVFRYSIRSGNSQEYFGVHEHKKQAKLLAAREFLRQEAVDLLELFESSSDSNGGKMSRSSECKILQTDYGFGKIVKARPVSYGAACHPYSRPISAVEPDPLSDPQRTNIAVHRVLAEIDRGEVITPYDALESLQDGLAMPKAIVNCTQIDGRKFTVTITAGNRIYGEAHHLLKPQAKRLAYDEAVKVISSEIFSRLVCTELDSYRTSGHLFRSPEDLLHEYVSRNFRTTVSFRTSDSERHDVAMHAKVHGIVIATGYGKNIEMAKSQAIRAAISDMCPYLLELLPRSPNSSHFFLPDADPVLFHPPEIAVESHFSFPDPIAYSPQSPSLHSNRIAPVSPVRLSDLPRPPTPTPLPLLSQRSCEKLMKPMDFGIPKAVLHLIEKTDNGSIATVSALFAAYLQSVERTTAIFDMRLQDNGLFRCDIIINGKNHGYGENSIKKQAKTTAIQNVMHFLCPVLMTRFLERNPFINE